MADGIVYILTNEAMPGYTKVGKTMTSVEERMRNLDDTGVPLPFECFYAARVKDVDFVEKCLHDAFGDFRVRKRREFFRVAPERVRSALELAKIEEVMLKVSGIVDNDDQVALDQARKRRDVFNFRMVDIPLNETLTLTRDESITCTVIGSKKVNFENEEMSLSAAALKAMTSLGYDWPGVSGPIYWQYEGETLDQRRRRMEEEE